jgi:hypothetical protein
MRWPAFPEEFKPFWTVRPPAAVRFIKLGRKSVWWPLARGTNTLRLGFRQFDFALCEAGKWEKAKEKFAAKPIFRPMTRP